MKGQYAQGKDIQSKWRKYKVHFQSYSGKNRKKSLAEKQRKLLHICPTILVFIKQNKLPVIQYDVLEQHLLRDYVCVPNVYFTVKQLSCTR